MILTGKEIKALAEYAGLYVQNDSGMEDADFDESEYSINRCPENGVTGDDGVARKYGYVVTCDGCEGNECMPLGDEIST